MMIIIARALGFAGIILLGYLLKKRGVFNRENGLFLGKIIVNITLPCALISAANSIEISMQSLMIVLIGLLANIVVVLFSWFRFRKDLPKKKALAMLNMPSYSIGTFAMPFVQSFFPASYLTYVCLFDIGNSIMCLGGTYAVASLISNPEEKMTLKGIGYKLLSSMPFCTYLLIVSFRMAGFTVPEAILSVTTIAGNANPFLCMFMMGLMVEIHLSRQDRTFVKEILIWRYILTAAFAIAMYCSVPLEFNVKKTILIMLSAPIAQMSPIFSLKIEPESAVPAATMSISILISVIVMTSLVICLS